MTSRTWVSSLRPKLPPGCDKAKSSALKPRASSRATAKASPMAICAVVLAVGARFKGQASLATLLSSTALACCASEDCKPPVMAIRGVPIRRMCGKMALSSSTSPELEIPSTQSILLTMPKSPWLASAGCTNMAGVPVDASVAAILRPTWPLLPIPITTTRPRVANISSMARIKAACCAPGAAKRACRPRRAAASMSKVSSAKAIAWPAFNVMGAF